jgi:hypothetical protein
MPVLSRALGVSTIAFGVLEFAKPDLWAKSTGISGPSPAMRTWHQTLGARDVVSGLAMSLAPAGPALRAGTLFRIVSDTTDALAFGLNAPTARLKAKAVGAALGSAALNALSLRWAGR